MARRLAGTCWVLPLRFKKIGTEWGSEVKVLG
jgi:hypothetical protein